MSKKILMIVFVIALLVTSLYVIHRESQDLLDGKSIIVPIAQSAEEQQHTQALEKWLDRFEEMENCPTGGMVDSNGYKSYGKSCYQMSTFVGKVKQYKDQYNLLPNAEDGEIANFISDNQFQRELTKIIIKEESYPKISRIDGVTRPAYADEWYNTIVKRGLGVAPSID